MKTSKKTLTALILNCIVVVIGVLGTIFSFLDIRITGSPVLIENSGTLQFFTVQSNMLITVFCAVAAVYEYLNLKKGIEIPKVYISIKLNRNIKPPIWPNFF